MVVATRTARSPARKTSPSPARSKPSPSPSKPAATKKTSGAPTPQPRPSSLFDRLQKDAHASEMDYTNTSPYFFLSLSLIQPPLMLWCADLLGVPRVLAALPLASWSASA